MMVSLTEALIISHKSNTAWLVHNGRKAPLSCSCHACSTRLITCCPGVKAQNPTGNFDSSGTLYAILMSALNWHCLHTSNHVRREQARGVRILAAQSSRPFCSSWYSRPCARPCVNRPRSYASGSDSEEEYEPVDIDALARQLSQEADRLRRTESNKEASTSEPTSSYPEPPTPIYSFEDPIFGQKVTPQCQDQCQ